MVTGIIIVIVIAIAAVLVYAATRPDSFRIERSATIKSAPDRIYALLDNFHNWSQWSPWEKLDPNLQRKFAGPEAGKGAVYEWQGDKNVGQGRMEITDSTHASRLLIKLDFLKPFEAHNTADFSLTPDGQGTKIVWAMYGPSPFMSKLMGIFFNMDKMVGKDFDTGLANLKAIAEK